MIEFPFKQVKSSTLGIILRPIATVKLIGPLNSLTAEFIIDSGADITIISKDVGEYLGLELEEGEKIANLGGIGGQIPFVQRTVEMRIGEVEFSCRVAWAFTENVPLLLGRADVFDQFRIELNQKQRKAIFKLSEI